VCWRLVDGERRLSCVNPSDVCRDTAWPGADNCVGRAGLQSYSLLNGTLTVNTDLLTHYLS
jgi:hypothetical protein